MATLEPIVVSRAVGTIATNNTYEAVEWSPERWRELCLGDHSDLLRPSAGSFRWDLLGRSLTEIRGVYRDGSRWNQIVRRPNPPLPNINISVSDWTLQVAVDRMVGWKADQFALKWIRQSQENGAPMMSTRDAATARRTNAGLCWVLSLRNE